MSTYERKVKRLDLFKLEEFNFKNFKWYCKIAGLKENNYKSLQEFKKFLQLKDTILKSGN